MQINTTYNMDALAAARLLPDGCVDCIVTSPPYYGLRDYGVDGQIGLEETPEVFIDHLVTVFRELWRVLKPEGTLWVNMGDSYAGSNRGADDVKPKDLIGIPWMLAFALRTDGWYLRQDIIWHKPNPMPESVTDPCTKAHEYIFLFSKSARYYFDAEAIKEPATGWNGSKFEDGKNLINHPNVGKNRQRKPAGWDTGKGGHGSFHRYRDSAGSFNDAQQTKRVDSSPAAVQRGPFRHVPRGFDRAVHPCRVSRRWPRTRPVQRLRHHAHRGQ